MNQVFKATKIQRHKIESLQSHGKTNTWSWDSQKARRTTVNHSRDEIHEKKIHADYSLLDHKSIETITKELNI